jgi:hypothetical protein
MTTLLKFDAIGRSSPKVARLRRRYKRRNEKIPAILGKGDGNDPYYGAGNNRIWIRRDGAANDDGDIGQTLPEKVFCGSGNYFAYDGARCWIELDPNGQWQVAQADNQDSEAAGVHTGLLNNGNPTNKWIRLRNVTRLKCLPVGTSANPSTLVGVRGNTYIDNYGDFNQFVATGTAAQKLDLASYIPGANLHAVVIVWLQTFDNTLTATASTSQATTSELDTTDYQEAYDAQPAESIPLQAFHLGDAQTSITVADLGQDLRSFINTPQAPGFPNPVDKSTLIRSGRTVTVSGTLTVTGTLTNLGTLTVVGDGTIADVWSDHEPSSVTLNTGTSASSVTDATVMYDGNTYDISEVTGVPGFDVEFNFTNIDTTRRFNFIVARWQYDGSATHFITIDIYNYTTTSWDEVRVFSNSNNYFASMTQYMPIGNQPNYVDANGNAKIRFYHQTSGNAAHDIHIDYVGLTHGVHQ